MGGGGGKGGGGSSDNSAQTAMYQEQFKAMQESQAATSKALSDYQTEIATKTAADKAAAEQKAIADGITQAKSTRDSLYSTYLDSANMAFSTVNDEITKEQSNADILGIDYSITDTQKNDRASKYLSNMWSSDQQTQLDQLITEHGAPTDYKPQALQRSDTAVAAPAAKAAPVQSIVSKPVGKSTTGTILTSDEEDDVLGG